MVAIFETTGQTLVVSEKEFSQTYHVSIYIGKQTNESDSERVSPEFATLSKAEAYVVDWMEKHPDGV